MENQDKRPEVWVARRLLRRKGTYYEPEIVGYFVSKARVQTVTKRFLENGQEVKEYEVEYETPKELEKLCDNGSDDYIETGDWVKVDRVFRKYITASDYIGLLNMKLEATKVKNIPEYMFDKAVKSIHKDVVFAIKLGKYFDGITIEDNREF